MITSQVERIKGTLKLHGLSQLWLANELYKTGKYKSKASLKVQLSYLINGGRFNETIQGILEDSVKILSGIDSSFNSDM